MKEIPSLAGPYVFINLIMQLLTHASQPPAPEGEPINLIIAVSFGLLVPPRIINGAEYGGINVHPSLLPE